MRKQTVWDLTFSMNEEGRKQLEAVVKKLNTTPATLAASIFNHSLQSIYDCLNSFDTLSTNERSLKPA